MTTCLFLFLYCPIINASVTLADFGILFKPFSFLVPKDF